MKTNTKIVRNKVRQHILDIIDNDVQLLRDNLNAVKYGDMSDYKAGIELVNGGTFLVYHDDVKDFLSGLGINPNNKEYTTQQSWDLYTHLVSSEIEKLVKELK